MVLLRFDHLCINGCYILGHQRVFHEFVETHQFKKQFSFLFSWLISTFNFSFISFIRFNKTRTRFCMNWMKYKHKWRNILIPSIEFKLRLMITEWMQNVIEKSVINYRYVSNFASKMNLEKAVPLIANVCEHVEINTVWPQNFRLQYFQMTSNLLNQ